MKRIPINDATNEQLRQFAQDTLQIEIHANSGRDKILATLGAAWSEDYINVMEDAESNQDGSPPQPPPNAKHVGKDMVRIIIARTEEVGGDEAVPVGVNGKVMLIPRGEPVYIPKSYFEVLQHAVTHRYEQRANNQGLSEPRKVPLYPVQLVAA